MNFVGCPVQFVHAFRSVVGNFNAASLLHPQKRTFAACFFVLDGVHKHNVLRCDGREEEQRRGAGNFCTVVDDLFTFDVNRSKLHEGEMPVFVVVEGVCASCVVVYKERLFKRCSAVYRKHAVARHSADNVHVAVQHNVAVVDNLAVIAGSVSLSRLAEVVLYTAKGKLSVNGKRYAAVYGNGDVGVNAHVPGNSVFISAFFVSRRVRCGVGNNQVNSLGNCRVLIEGNVFVQYQVGCRYTASGSQSLFQSLVEVVVYSCRVGAVRFDDSRVGNVADNCCGVGCVVGQKLIVLVHPTVEGVTVVYLCRQRVVSSAVRKTVCWYFGVGRYAAALFVAHACGNGVLLTYKTHVCNGKCVFVGFAVVK